MTELQTIAQSLVQVPKGILAADESVNSANKRLESLGLDPTSDRRREYRELLLTAPGLGQYINGVILYEETLKDTTRDGRKFVDVLREGGMLVGIKVDSGLVPLVEGSSETVTKGLEDLAERLVEYKKYGAVFTKWRAAYVIGNGTPSEVAIVENAKQLAKYAKIVQGNGMVPIVEPEVLMDGSHGIEECEVATQAVLKAVFEQLRVENVDLAGMILKPNMVVPGTTGAKVDVKEVAERTVKVLRERVPSEVSGIAFLSGGQAESLANDRLRAINNISDLPWRVTYSFSRALMMTALELWRGDNAKWDESQRAFVSSAAEASNASIGK